MDNKATIQDVPLDSLEKLYYIFDDLGCSVEYSRDMGELIIRVGGKFELELLANQKVMSMMATDKYWADDADRVAEGYWRQ